MNEASRLESENQRLEQELGIQRLRKENQRLKGLVGQLRKSEGEGAIADLLIRRGIKVRDASEWRTGSAKDKKGKK